MYESENENYKQKKSNNQSGFADNSMENEGIDQDNVVSSKYPNSILTRQSLGEFHRYKGQLCVDRRICCCSQFMIFLFELLGPAKQPMACPSSSNRKIMN